jgi:hypothetical protein
VSTEFSSSSFSASAASPTTAPRRAYKVLASIPRFDGKGEWMMRIGSAYQNRDDSINLYLDVLPVGGANGKVRLQIRELDAADLARREQYRAGNAAAARGHDPAGFAPPPATAAADGVPF